MQNRDLNSGLSCSDPMLFLYVRTPEWQLSSGLVNSHFNTLFCKRSWRQKCILSQIMQTRWKYDLQVDTAMVFGMGKIYKMELI